MILTTINIDIVKDVAHFVENNYYDCNTLLNAIKGKVTNQRISDNANSIIIEGVSDKIATIVIGCNDNMITYITFYGLIDINPKELSLLFKDSRESYSIRDDLYFYFFNEDKLNDSYT